MPVVAAIGVNPAGVSAAFAAGFISFISPCVWPLVPAYLSYVSGVTFGELEQQTRRVVMSTAAFVLGFTVVFTLIGAGAGVLGGTITSNRRALEIAAGVLVIAMGALLAGFGGRLLLQEKRLQVTKRRGLVGAFVAGLAFAIGWTPCIGPTLGAIVTMAAASDTVWAGAALLVAYAIGMAIPFVVVGLGMSRFGGLRRFLNTHERAFRIASGSLIVAVGVLVASGAFGRLAGLVPWSF